ncbi:MAG: hypothetical protein HYT08_02880 [Candidatus Levybacteria bacterium]|nr:hypothetical protein [Candidatus Levybacteria bacterium]
MAKIVSIDSKHEKTSRQRNLFKLIWEWFLSLDGLSRLFIVSIILIAVATPSIVSTYLIFNPKAAITSNVGTSYSVAPSSSQPIAPKSLVSGSGIAPAQNYTVDSEIINLLALFNNYRAQKGLSVLTPSLILTEVAKWMANDMASKNYFSHTDSLGRDPFKRQSDFGYTFNTWRGENLASGSQTGSEALEAWKGSPGHNANLLNPNYTAVGFYRAYNPNSTFGWYWAQELGGTIDTPVSYIASTPTSTPTPTPVPTASIRISHNPCLVISGTSCTSTISWSTSGYPSAYICTSSGSGEAFFASGNSGTKQIAFPTTRTYQFIMRTPTSNTCGSGAVINSTSALFSTGGDVNCDGSITSVDALLVQRYVAKLSITGTKCSTGSNTINATQADVDKNGRVDSVDSLFILKYVAS